MAADLLPRLAVITNVDSYPRGLYAYYKNETEEDRGFVTLGEESIFSLFVKIQIERAKIDSKYVHLRFSHTNKYWARRGEQIIPTDRWIFACANQPEEDTSKWSCTLFEPKLIREGAYTLTHVHSGKRVTMNRSSQWETDRLYIDDSDTGSASVFCNFGFIDWETLVIMPKHVAFKGYNDKYLRAGMIQRYEYNQFSSDDGNQEATAYEVTLHRDGHIRIWSKLFGKFWRRSPNWIWADSTDTDGTDIDTLFWPVKVNDKTIALRNAGNNRFCSSLTTEGKTNCLNAAVTSITEEARLVVEELILERDTYNVEYRVEDARIFDERVVIVGTGSATNNTQIESTYSKTISYEDESSFSFSNSVSIMAGVKTTIQTGLPRIFEGKIEITAEVTNSFEWNRTTTERRKTEATYTVVVPPMTQVVIHYLATQGSCDVPFSYTRRDKRASDGQFLVSREHNGVYRGANYYNFHFDQPSFARMA